jgi:hypothetical protein
MQCIFPNKFCKFFTKHFERGKKNSSVNLTSVAFSFFVGGGNLAKEIISQNLLIIKEIFFKKKPA